MCAKKVVVALVAIVAWGCAKPTLLSQSSDTDGQVVPRWHYVRAVHGFEGTVINDIWTRSDGAVVAVAQFGRIMTNIQLDATVGTTWRLMPSPTQVHLEAIVGVENGDVFGLPAINGEMFAVGWSGTVLHFHPDPNQDGIPDDGRWTIIAGQGGPSFQTRTRADPACPDFDGDGILDDGGGIPIGWAGDAICAPGVTTLCDDNCRTAANGTDRPLQDTNQTGDNRGCLDPGDLPKPANAQLDSDNDGLGDPCDTEIDVPVAQARFDIPLFDIAAKQTGGELMLTVVGGGGALLTINGRSVGDTLSTKLLVTDAAAWIVQPEITYRWDSDCGAGPVCGGRLPPLCPARCYPRKTQCPCINQGQCCDTGAGLTGAGGSSAAPNQCDPDTFTCLDYCPDCFRRLGKTLRSVSFGATKMLTLGADGSLLLGDPQLPAQHVATTPVNVYWRAPMCIPTPLAIAEGQVLRAASSFDGNNFIVVGSAGTILTVDTTIAVGPGCVMTSITGAPAGFLTDVVAVGGNVAYAVGDGGLLLEIKGTTVTPLEPDIDETLNAIAVTTDPTTGRQVFWLGGAGGTLVQASFY